MTATPNRADLLAALDRERAALQELLLRFDDARWRAAARDDGWSAHDIIMHIADSSYGLSLLLLGEVQTNLSVDQRTGWYNPDEHNERRRHKNAALSREKVLGRVAGAFEQARRAVESVDDVDAPSPLSELYTKGQWLERMVDHIGAHRRELEALLEPGG